MVVFLPITQLQSRIADLELKLVSCSRKDKNKELLVADVGREATVADVGREELLVTRNELEAELEELEGAELEEQLLQPATTAPAAPVHVPAGRQQTRPAPRQTKLSKMNLLHCKQKWLFKKSLANVDPVDVARNISGLNPETTLVVVSKTFTTVEMMLNARTLREWIYLL